MHHQRRNEARHQPIGRRTDKRLHGRGHASPLGVEVQHQQRHHGHHQRPAKRKDRNGRKGPPGVGGEQEIGAQVQHGHRKHDDEPVADLALGRNASRQPAAEPCTAHDP